MSEVNIREFVKEALIDLLEKAVEEPKVKSTYIYVCRSEKLPTLVAFDDEEKAKDFCNRFNREHQFQSEDSISPWKIKVNSEENVWKTNQ